jgi:Flp pilus assembly protein TadG
MRLRAPDPHRPRRGGRRAANAIEFALTFPLFLVIVLGLVDYGYLFAVQAGLDNAAALACREGAMTDPAVGSPSAVATAELTSRSAMFCAGACTQSVQDLQTGAYVPPNRTLRCEVTRNVDPITGFSGVGVLSAMYPNAIGSVSYYRLEWQR